MRISDWSSDVCSSDLAWFATADERLIGVITEDRQDQNFCWVVLGRDERMRYRAIDQNASLPSVEASRDQMFAAMATNVMFTDEAYHQVDAPKEPVDFIDNLQIGSASCRERVCPYV